MQWKPVFDSTAMATACLCSSDQQNVDGKLSPLPISQLALI